MNDLFKRVMNEPKTIPTIFIIYNDGCPMKRWKPIDIEGLPNFVKQDKVPAIGNLDMYIDDRIVDIEKKFDAAITKASSMHKIVLVPMYKVFKPLLKCLAVKHFPVVYVNNLYRENDETGTETVTALLKGVSAYNADYELYTKLMGSSEDKARMNSLIPQDIMFTVRAFRQFACSNDLPLPIIYTYDSVDDIIEHFTRLNDDDASIIYNIIDKAMNNSFYIDMRVFDN